MEYNRLVGRISWWKLVIATYIPGNRRVMKAAKNLKPRKKLAKLDFRFVSSGDAKKSIKIAGMIRP